MLKKGSKVSVKFEDKVFEGFVVKCHKNKTYDIDCEDGDCIDHCPEADITLLAPPEPKKILNLEELERKADNDRKAKVDKENAAKAAKDEAEQDALADTPLNAEEKTFIAIIRPRMNYGRQSAMPSSADITRYARLIGREKIK